ncbi:hypothetical protein [Jiangella endophytica]|uniref:hypothetical protein n=1 Tax=Jiangella endophytica TaxID=1623398 RepID=UPI0013002273|nr:hypothetical protein [Jiangella endophytica]
MAAAFIQCRYMRLNGEQCTGEALDPDGEILLCMKHAGRVMVMVREAHAKKLQV